MAAKIEVPASLDRLSPLAARIVLAVGLAVCLLFVGITCSDWKSGYADAANRGPGDVELYRAEVERVGRGESYYSAAAAELHERGYPTRSIFNWRTPLPMWLIGRLGKDSAGALLGVIAMGLVCFSFTFVQQQAGLRQAVFTVLLLTGALMPCTLDDLFVMPEIWAGVLIAFSVSAYGIGRSRFGLAAGLAALFVRELAAPYCLLSLALAWRGKRRWEAGAWLGGLAAYAIFYAWHVSQVLPRIGPHDVAHAQGWLRFGGAAFLISTVQMNVYLLLLPQWLSAIYLVAALLGAINLQSSAGQRVGLTIALYSMAFSVVGQSFNQYWGSLTAPVLCLAAAQCPSAVCRLWRRAVEPLPAQRLPAAVH